MSKDKLLTNYVSPIDKFLDRFDEEHPRLSKSQQKEIAKYKRIAAFRDDPHHPDEKKLPEGF